MVFISKTAPNGFKGMVFGIFGIIQGIGLLLSSIIAGAMWDRISSDAPFKFGGIFGIVSAIIIVITLGKNNIYKLPKY